MILPAASRADLHVERRLREFAGDQHDVVLGHLRRADTHPLLQRTDLRRINIRTSSTFSGGITRVIVSSKSFTAAEKSFFFEQLHKPYRRGGEVDGVRRLLCPGYQGPNRSNCDQQRGVQGSSHVISLCRISSSDGFIHSEECRSNEIR